MKFESDSFVTKPIIFKDVVEEFTIFRFLSQVPFNKDGIRVQIDTNGMDAVQESFRTSGWEWHKETLGMV